jgi:hypothetical protein
MRTMKPHYPTAAAAAAWSLGCLIGLFMLSALGTPARAADLPSLAFLGVQFQNDNEGLEPTTEAERARLKRTETEFVAQLAASGRYRIVPTPEGLRSKIAAAQTLGECGECEIDFGKQAAADLIAWIRVQKVSNLILNMNVYMEDVVTKKMLLVSSVDLRGNTDESWSRTLAYLIKNSVLPADTKHSL